MAHASDPLLAWKSHLLARGDLTYERLVPEVVVAASLDEFAFIQRGVRIDRAAAQRLIAETAPWTYHCEVDGVSSRAVGTYNDDTIRFHRYRANLIVGTLATMYGPQLASKSVVDIGCNNGFFALEVAARGAGEVLGIDVRQQNLLQAEALKRIFAVPATFRIGNVKEGIPGGPFDVVLNLGLMYHLSTPFEVLRACFAATREVCVVDANTHTEPFSGYHLALKDPASPLEGDLAFELQPTYRGLLDTLRAAGFVHIVEVTTASPAVDLYRDGSRRCLFAFKIPPDRFLDRLPIARS